MTREDAALVVKYFDIVKAFAEGSILEFHMMNCNGRHVSWDHVIAGIHVRSLSLYRIVKRVKGKRIMEDRVDMLEKELKRVRRILSDKADKEVVCT